MKTKKELIEEIENKIATLEARAVESKKFSVAAPEAQYQIAISNLYIALINTYSL